MRRTAGTCPCGPAVIVALRTEVDVRVVLVREAVRSGQKEIVGRGQHLSQLIGVNESGHDVRPHASLMRIMADDASDPDVGVVGQRGGYAIRRQPADHGQSNRTRVAPAAGIDAIRRTHIFHDRKVAAGLPFVVRGMVRPRVAAAAKLPRDFFPWAFGQVHFIRCMCCRRAVAAFTLHPCQPGCVRIFFIKAGGQSVTYRVAWQTGGVLVLANICQGLQCLGVPCILLEAMDSSMAFRARLGSGELGRGTGDFVKGSARRIRDNGMAHQIGRADRLPDGIRHSQRAI